MAALMPNGKQQYFDNNGNPLSGGKLHAYAAGTNTPQATYTTAAGNIENTNPVVLNSRGEASVFFSDLAYKLVLKGADDAEIWTADNLLTGSGTTWINVKSVGALGDGVTDDTARIQAAINSLIGTGGVIWFPKGNYRTSSPLLLYSDIQLWGQGMTNTFIRPLNSASFTAAQAVVMTAGFVQDQDLWDFYPTYPAGIHMGVGIRGICIDGNRASVANANGLMIYGGKWLLKDMAVINTQGHGIWTECGSAGNSTSGDDLHDFLNMHEAYGENIYISNTNKHGWWYRGPNDSYINNVQIKVANWSGFFQDMDVSGTISVGNLEIGSLHAYSCNCANDNPHTLTAGAMIEISNALVGRLYVDSSKKHGVRFYGSASIANQVFTLLNNNANAGDYWGTRVEAAGVQIGSIKSTNNPRTTGTTNGGDVWIEGDSCLIGQIRTVYGSGSTIVSKGVVIEANDVNIGDAVIQGYTPANSVGLSVDGSRNSVRALLRSCHKGLDYQNTSESLNKLNLTFLTNTTDYTSDAGLAGSDILDFTSDQFNFNSRTTGTATIRHLTTVRQSVNFATSITLNASQNSFVKIGDLTNNLTMNAPSNPTGGDRLTIIFRQDGTGGRTISWDPATNVFKHNYSDAGNTAFKRHSISFVYDEDVGFWIQDGAASGWF